MEIATDKTDVEIEAPASGVLHNVLVGPGDIVPVGQVIAVIVPPGEVVASGWRTNLLQQTPKLMLRRDM